MDMDNRVKMVHKDNKTPAQKKATLSGWRKKKPPFQAAPLYEKTNIANYPFNTGECDKYFLEG